MDFKLSWALVVVLVGVGMGYFGRGIIAHLKAPGAQQLSGADYSAPSSWVGYRFAQWADRGTCCVCVCVCVWKGVNTHTARER
jgi:hypothetical protein